MKIAIIGSGISGLTAAYYLSPHAEVSLFEKEQRLGGHTATVDVNLDGRHYAIDTGFIVYNEKTYPNFIRLMNELAVAVKKTTMGFSVSSKVDGLEYAGNGLSAYFAQKRRIFSFKHWKMLFEIMRFNKQAPKHLMSQAVTSHLTLRQYLKNNHYSQTFIDSYLIPMGAAIWSASTSCILDMPVKFFIRFFKNHGLLQIKNRPQWYVIDGGSRNYIGPFIRSMDVDIRLNTHVSNISYHDGKIRISVNGRDEYFDEVIFACHSDQALALLDHASAEEREVLSAIKYEANEVVLHTDEALLPHCKKAWSSWNYSLYNYDQHKATLTYNMNILQDIKAPVTFCVTLNDSAAIDPEKVLATFSYSHPVFTLDSLAAQKKWALINGHKQLWFCGAYWRNGFHEDGVVSALWAVNGLLKKLNKPYISVL